MHSNLLFFSLLSLIVLNVEALGDNPKAKKTRHGDDSAATHLVHDRGAKFITIITPSGRILSLKENHFKPGANFQIGKKVELNTEYYTRFLNAKDQDALKLELGNSYEVLHIDYEKDHNVIVTIETPSGKRFSLNQSWLDRTKPIRVGEEAQFNNSLITEREFEEWKKRYPKLTLDGKYKIVEINRRPYSKPKKLDALEKRQDEQDSIFDDKFEEKRERRRNNFFESMTSPRG